MSGSAHHVEHLEVAGLAIRLEAHDAEDLALLRRILGSTPSTREVDVTVRIGPNAPSLPDRAPDFVGPYGEHWDDGERHAFRHTWGLHAEVTADRADLGGTATGHSRWVTVRNSMLFVIARLFYERGLFLLHGAALRRGDEAFIAIGDSGTGKSTLAYSAHLAGWTILGDDMVLVDARGPHPTVRGVPRVPSIPGEVAELTRASGDPVPRDERSRVELEGHPMDLAVAELSAVVICAHAADEGSVVAVEPTAALGELVPAFVLADLPGPMRRWFPVATRLANGCCVMLSHAADPAERIAGAPALLDQVVQLRDDRRHRP